MKTFNQNFSAVKDAAKSSPVTLMVLHLGSGDLNASDRDIDTVDGPAFTGLVTSWGEFTMPASGPSGFRMPEATVELHNAGPGPLSASLEAGVPENTLVDVYQWFEGIPYADKEPIGRFVISSPLVYTGETVRIKLTGSAVTKNTQTGHVITRQEYPDADPDAVGRCENIVYGRVEGLACHPVSAGAATTLAAGVDEYQTDGISLSLAVDEAPMPVSGTLQMGAEKISYTGISGRTLTGVTRGVSGTSPQPHKKGSVAFQLKDSYEYLVAGHPVRSIGEVYVDGVRVASGVTRLPDDSGKAKLVFSEKFTLEKSVDLDIDEGSHEHTCTSWSGEGTQSIEYGAYRWAPTAAPGWTAGEHTGNAFKDADGHYFLIYDNTATKLFLAGIHGQTVKSGTYTGTIIRTQVDPLYQDTFSSSFNGPPVGLPTALCDGNWNSYCSLQVDSGYIITTRSAPVSDKGIIVGAKLAGTYGHSGSSFDPVARSIISGGAFTGQQVYGGGPSVQTVRTATTLTKGSPCVWSDFAGMTLKAMNTGSGAAAYWEHWVEVFYIPYGGGASPASGVSLKGNSAADVVVGGQVCCDVEGYADDVYGTYTGTTGALIENPADVVRHFMSVQMGMGPDEFDGSFEAARQELAGLVPGGYRLAGAVRAQADALDLLESLSFQSRLSIAHDGFTARVRVLPGSAAGSARLITPSMIRLGSLRVTRTGRDEVINRLPVHYMRDLSKDGAQATSYLEVADASELYPSDGDPVSVALYGGRSPARPFAFGFVRDGAMAVHLRDFYITAYKDAARRVEFSCFLDSMGLEPGDLVELEGALPVPGLEGAVFVVEDVSFRPGSLKSGRPDEVSVRAREV